MKKLKVYDLKDYVNQIRIPKIITTNDLTIIDGTNVYMCNKDMSDHLHGNNIPLIALNTVNFGGINLNVIMCDSYFNKLPKNVQNAFIAHEVGHASLNHLNGLTKEESDKIIIKRIFGLIPKMEFEADAYAASMIGKSQLKEAFKFMIKNTNLPLNSKFEMVKRYCKL